MHCSRRTTWLSRYILTGILIASSASAALAQTPANDAAPKTTPSSVTSHVDFGRASLSRAARGESDSVLNGALIGAGVAVGGALFMCTRMEPWENCRDDVGPMLKVGAIGAGIGIAIDALIGRKTRRGAEARPSVGVAPVVTRQTRGVRMAFSF